MHYKKPDKDNLVDFFSQLTGRFFSQIDAIKSIYFGAILHNFNAFTMNGIVWRLKQQNKLLSTRVICIANKQNTLGKRKNKGS